MKNTSNDRKITSKCITLIVFLLFFISVVSQLIGCGYSKAATEEDQVVLPGFGDILTLDELVPDPTDDETKILPVKVYMDNTGSMAGYIIDKYGRQKNPDDNYKILMRCIRDMGMMQNAQYYVLNGEKSDWVLYKKSLFEHFGESDFYTWWPQAVQDSGPLTKLYMEEMLDNSCINIVLTDLSEQRLNNTALAEKIQKMCTEENCEVDLYAFKFVFNGKTQVPKPDAISEMSEKEIKNKKKPYYMIITGPADVMGRYRKGLKELLNDAGLKAGKDYHTATSKTNLNQDKALFSDIVFHDYADFETIRAEGSSKQQEQMDENTGVSTKKNNEEIIFDMTQLTKNLTRYEDISNLMKEPPEIDMAAFKYEKVKGIPKKLGDWRLLFQVPLKSGGKDDLTYSCQYHIYTLLEKEPEEEGKELQMIWEEDKDSGIQVMAGIEKDENQPLVSPQTYCFSISGGKDASENKAALVLLEIYKDQTYVYQSPKWLNKYDTGTTKDYFTRTFNLKGFYNVLFCGGNGFMDGRETNFKSSYIKIPILLTNLDQR